MKVSREIAIRVFQTVEKKLASLEDFSEEKIKEALISVVEELGLKNGQVFWPVRAGLTGEERSPGVFEVIWALGKEETMKRLQKLSTSF